MQDWPLAVFTDAERCDLLDAIEIAVVATAYRQWPPKRHQCRRLRVALGRMDVFVEVLFHSATKGTATGNMFDGVTEARC
jgi:hypothetical protein